MRQQGAIFTITDDLMHVRQCLRSIDKVRLNGFKWDLRMESNTQYLERNNIIFGEFNHQCAKLVKHGNCNNLNCSESQSLSYGIRKTIASSNRNFGILFKTHVDVVNGIFPSNTGIKCLIFFKSSTINNINREQKQNNQLDTKIKYKFIYDNINWDNNVDIQMKLEVLSYELSRFIITCNKVVIGRTWNGAWYVPKKKILETKQYTISFNGSQEPSEQLITKHELFITYNKEKPLNSFELIRKESEISFIQNQCDISIKAITFSNLFTQNVGQHYAQTLHNFIKKPKEYLQQFGKVEYNKKENRIKYWCGQCPYYYNGASDRETLGECFPLAMKVANGVRLYDGFTLPEPIAQIQSGLLESKIIDDPTESIALNCYYNDTDKYVSSGIGEHNESDRFRDLIHITFTSGDPSANTVLSINQSKLHGTAEVDIPSVHLEIIRFDS